MKDEFVIIKDTLVKYKGSSRFVEIPEGVATIGDRAFQMKKIQSVSMPDTVKVIGNEAFSNCEKHMRSQDV